MNKKGLALGVVVVVAGLAVSPNIIGTQAEAELREHIQLFDQEQPGYTLEIIEYERNWFSSSAQLKLGIDLPTLLADPEAEVLSTDIELSIQHGPILTDQGLSIGLAAWQAKNDGKGLETYLAWDANQPFYLQQGSVSLFGNAVYQDYIPQLESTEALEDLQVSLTEYRGDGSYDGSEFAYQGNYETLLLGAEDEFAVELNAMAVKVDADADLKTMIVGKYYPSVVNFTLGQMRVNSADEELFLMSHLVSDIALKESADGEYAHIHAGYRADKLLFAGNEASNLRFMTELNNIDRDFVDDYISTMKEMIGVDDPQVLESTMTAMMEDHQEALLRGQPELVIRDLGFSMPEGALSGSARMGLAEIEQVPARLDPKFVQEHLVADARIAIDQPLAERLARGYVMSMLEAADTSTMDPAELEQMASQQAQALLQNFIQQGMLTVDGERYLFTLDVADGVLNLNGQSMPLMHMM